MIASAPPTLSRVVLVALTISWAALAAGTGVALAAPAGGIAPLWFANAGVLALALRYRRDETVIVTAFGLALVLINLRTGNAPGVSVGFAIANLVELVFALRMLRRLDWGGGDRQLSDDVRVLLLTAGIAAPLVSTLAALPWLVFVAGDDPLTAGLRWFTADALGVGLLAPLLTNFGRGDLRALRGWRAGLELAAVLGLVGATATATFLQPDQPLLFLNISALLLAAVRLRFSGAAAATILAAAIAVPLTVSGFGPIAHSLPDPAVRVLLLQAFLAVASLTTLPVAAMLADRRRLLGRLASADRVFRSLTQNVPVGIFRADAVDRVTFGNAGWHDLIGVEDSRGQCWLDYFDPRGHGDLQADRDLATRTGEAFERDVQLVNARWVHLRMTPNLADGVPRAWLAAVYDIERRREEERALTESEQRYRLLAEHSHDMIVRIGLDGVRRFVSPAARRILGFDPAALVGDTPIAQIHPDDRARVERVCRTLWEGAVDPVCVYRQQRADGSYVKLEAIYRLVRNDAGDPVEFVASVRDISQRDAAERAAALAVSQYEEANRLLLMAEGMAGVGHWRLDARTRGLFWSDEVYRIHGVPRDQLPDLAEGVGFYHPDDRARISELVRISLEEGKPWAFQARIVRRDGEQRDVVSRGQPELAPNGEVVGVFGVFQDVTDRVRTETALITARDAAEAATRAKSAFLATMSHEIRTPMSGMLGMIDLLRTDRSPTDRRRFYDALEQSAQLLMTLLDDVLDFSKLESGALVLERTDFDLVALTQNVVDLFYLNAVDKGLTLSFAHVDDTSWVRGDPTRVRQVLSNLVSNAIKFTPSGTVTVRLTVLAQGGKRAIRFEVADTGIGIAAAEQERLFAPFVQADASTTRLFGGTGLGLAISQQLVAAMGGTIGVTSALGEGATFAFDLMLDRASAAITRGEQPRIAGTRAVRPLDVLIAEDDAINRLVVSTLVEQAGHRTQCVENGRLAVEAAAGTRFDLIFMDMQMPELDGLAATDAIRASGGPNAATPIIALTADAAPERRALYAGHGLSSFMVKPIDAEELARRLRETADAAPIITADEPVFDEAKLDALYAAFGATGADRLLAMLADELATTPARIAALAASGNAAARAQAHGLKGAAANCAAIRLAAAAAAVEVASDEALGTAGIALTRVATTTDAALASLRARRAS